MPRSRTRTVGRLAPLREPPVSRRLPRPKKIRSVKVEVSDDEMRMIEDGAHACRLSLASYMRALAIVAGKQPGQWAEPVAAEAEKIIAEAKVTNPGKKRGPKPRKP